MVDAFEVFIGNTSSLGAFKDADPLLLTGQLQFSASLRDSTAHTNPPISR